MGKVVALIMAMDLVMGVARGQQRTLTFLEQWKNLQIRMKD